MKTNLKQHNLVKSISSIFFLLLLVLLLNACKSSADKQAARQKQIVCFIDFSETADWPARMEKMQALVANSVIGKLSFNTKLIILPIDKASATGGKEILTGTTLDEFDYIPDMTSQVDEETVSKENLEKIKDSLKSIFNTRFPAILEERKGQARGTDIFGALEEAKRYATNTKNTLVILLSDMMNWSADLKMEQSNFNASNLEKGLEKAPAVQLSGSSVFVFTGDVSYIDAVHYNTVKSFWKQYFQKNNMPLIDYSSAAVSELEKNIGN